MKNLQAYTICLLILFLPLPLGGMQSWSKTIMVVVLAFLFFLSALKRIVSGFSLNNQEIGWLGIYLCLSLYIVFQLFSYPEQWLNECSWCISEYRISGGVVPSRLSAFPLASIQYFAMFTAYWSIAFMVSTMPQRLVLLLVVSVILIAGFEAVYSLFVLSTDTRLILGVWEKTRFFDAATGTFHNKNHLAALLTLVLPLLLGVIFDIAKRKKRSGALLLAVSAVLILLVGLALIMSNSRLGIVSAFLGVVVLVIVNPDYLNSIRAKILTITILSGVILLVAIWFGVGDVLNRFLLSSEQMSSRTETWSAIFNLPARYWLLGVGAGNFIDVYPLVQPASQEASYLRMHNEYLQFLLEFGFVGIFLLGVSVKYFFSKNHFPEINSGLRAGMVGGVIGIMIHCIGDFDLQIPGVAISFWVVTGLLFNKNTNLFRA